MPVRATNVHPLVKKLERIFQKMEEEGITISWGYNCFLVKGDNEIEWEMKDLDQGLDEFGPTNLPPNLEYKLVREA